MIDSEFEKDCKEVTVIKVDYTAIEHLIDRHFKNEKHKEGYELPCLEERGSGDGEDWEISICPEKIKRGDYYYSHLTTIKSGKWPQFATRALLNHLCFQGVVRPGRYLIDISW